MQRGHRRNDSLAWRSSVRGSAEQSWRTRTEQLNTAVVARHEVAAGAASAGQTRRFVSRYSHERNKHNRDLRRSTAVESVAGAGTASSAASSSVSEQALCIAAISSSAGASEPASASGVERGLHFGLGRSLRRSGCFLRWTARSVHDVPTPDNHRLAEGYQRGLIPHVPMTRTMRKSHGRLPCWFHRFGCRRIVRSTRALCTLCRIGNEPPATLAAVLGHVVWPCSDFCSGDIGRPTLHSVMTITVR